MAMRTRRVVGMIIVGLLGLLILPKLPGCVMAHSPKYGRVVDAATGKGIPDAVVLASAFYTDDPVGLPIGHSPSGSGVVLYHVATHTDANGSYRFPTTSPNPRILVPSVRPRFRWVVTAYKWGHGVVGDEKAWSTFDEYGRAKWRPPSTTETPCATWLGLVVRVCDLRMTKVDLTLREAAYYYREIAIVRGIFRGRPPEVARISEEAGTHFMSEVCAMEPDRELFVSLANNLEFFTRDRVRASRYLEQAQPATRAFQHYREKQYRARTVCAAMKAGNAPPEPPKPPRYLPPGVHVPGIAPEDLKDFRDAMSTLEDSQTRTGPHRSWVHLPERPATMPEIPAKEESAKRSHKRVIRCKNGDRVFDPALDRRPANSTPNKAVFDPCASGESQ